MTKVKICARCRFPLGCTAGGADLCARCLARRMGDILSEPATEPADDAPLPRQFGAYELLREIGRGGIGVVFCARQIALDRTVALKLLLAGGYSTETMLSRFHSEAAAAAMLHHPNIVPVYDYGECDGHPFYAMEFVDGCDLDELCGGSALPPHRSTEILSELARAVHYAHQKGVIHRDLKPSNVLIDKSGRPHITDFGLARRLDETSSASAMGQILVSPSYTPPEQAADRREQISFPSDVYGLGALMYHLLTGRAPFHGKTPTETLRRVLDTDPTPPRLLNPRVPRELDAICLKCLAKEPVQRYPRAFQIKL